MTDEFSSDETGRPLSTEEEVLLRSMLERAGGDAEEFLPQVERARVSSACLCGCASFDLEVSEEAPIPERGMRILGDFLFDDSGDEVGIYVFERGGLLAGVEVWSPSGEAVPDSLPDPDSIWLAPWADGMTLVDSSRDSAWRVAVVGLAWVNGPVFALLFGVPFVGASLFPDQSAATIALIVLGFVSAWGYWSYAVPRWRLWPTKRPTTSLR